MGRKMKKTQAETKQGFTLIEVMLVLAITGLMLLGVLGGTYTAVRTQRYNDSVTTFAEKLRQVYNEVLSPRSKDDASGNSLDTAIYGKMIVFEEADAGKKLYVVTLVGDVDPPVSNDGLLQELIDVSLRPQCETISEYTPNWDAEIFEDASEPFSGVVMIVRAPNSGGVHTIAVRNGRVDLANGACETTAAKALGEGLLAWKDTKEEVMTEPTNFCLKSPNASTLRAVQLEADGANASAVKILDEEQSREAGC